MGDDLTVSVLLYRIFFFFKEEEEEEWNENLDIMQTLTKIGGLGILSKRNKYCFD